MKFSKIKSIKKLKDEPVYDLLNVEKNNNFIANNFVVHNSENKELKKKLAQVRTKHLLFILCFPLKIYKVEKTYLENFVNYWCLTKDAKIITRDYNGVIRNTPIINLNRRYPEILTYNIKNNKYEFKEYEKKIKTKKNAEIFELELENDLTIKCTEDHPFLTSRGWVRLNELRDTDKLFVKGSTRTKIKKIRKLPNTEDVFDIVGVKDNHNFVANNMVVHNCDLYGRGVGAVYVKDKNPVQDSWRMKMFGKIGSYTEFTNQQAVISKLKKHPNFWIQIKFPKPPRWLYEKYLKVREANVYDDDVVLQNVSKQDIHNALLVLSLRDILMHDSTLTMNRILLHIRNEYDVQLRKTDINNAIEDAKQLVMKVREKVIEA